MMVYLAASNMEFWLQVMTPLRWGMLGTFTEKICALEDIVVPWVIKHHSMTGSGEMTECITNLDTK